MDSRKEREDLKTAIYAAMESDAKSYRSSVEALRKEFDSQALQEKTAELNELRRKLRRPGIRKESSSSPFELIHNDLSGEKRSSERTNKVLDADDRKFEELVLSMNLLRQQLEDLQGEVEDLRNEIRTAETPPGTRVQNNDMQVTQRNFRDYCDLVLPPVRSSAIRNEDRDEQQALEFNEIKGSKHLTEGASFKIKPEEEAPENSSIAVVEIGNYLDSSLWDYQFSSFHADPEPLGSVCKVIGAAERQEISYISKGNMNFLVSFTIGTTSTKLFIALYKYEPEEVTEFGLAFDTSSTSTNYSLFESILKESNQWGHRGFHKVVGKPRACLYIRYGYMRAKATLEQSSPNQIRVEIGTVGLNLRLELKFRKVLEERVPLLCPGQESVQHLKSLLEPSRDNTGCVIKIGNGTGADLWDRIVLFEVGKSDQVSSRIGSMSCSTVIAHHNNTIRGFASYRIGSAPIRCILAFEVQEARNNFFGAGFVHSNTSFAEDLLESISKRCIFNSEYGYICGQATCGEINASVCNIQISARMTNDKKSVLELLVHTF